MEKEKIKVNLLICGIISLVIGILYIFIGLYLWDTFLLDWAIVMTVEGCICDVIGFSLITKHILPDKKLSFLWGLFLGIIGVIVTICMKNKNNNSNKINSNNSNNKYEDLQRLQQLKNNGTLTEEEFEIEKMKILK